MSVRRTAPQVVGRDREQAAIPAFLDAIRERFGALLFAGPAGIGKTTLWEAAVAEARARGYRVVVSRPEMTTIAQRRTIVASPAVGLALAASMLGGIAGGAVAVAVPAVIQARADQDAAAAAERAKWLQYGQEWERRYRQMYPILEGG